MHNLTPKMNQPSIEINGNLHLLFFKFGMMKVFETLHTYLKYENKYFQMKIFNEITLLLFIIYSFIKFKVLVSLP